MVVAELNDENYDATVAQDGIVVVDAWATWCGPCRMFAPVFEKAALEFPDHTFAKLDTQANDTLVKSLGIEHIPTLIIYRDGVMVYHKAGSPEARVLADIISEVEELDMTAVRAEIATQEGGEAEK